MNGLLYKDFSTEQLRSSIRWFQKPTEITFVWCFSATLNSRQQQFDFISNWNYRLSKVCSTARTTPAKCTGENSARVTCKYSDCRCLLSAFFSFSQRIPGARGFVSLVVVKRRDAMEASAALNRRLRHSLHISQWTVKNLIRKRLARKDDFTL